MEGFPGEHVFSLMRCRSLSHKSENGGVSYPGTVSPFNRSPFLIVFLTTDRVLRKSRRRQRTRFSPAISRSPGWFEFPWLTLRFACVKAPRHLSLTSSSARSQGSLHLVVKYL